MKKMNKLYLRGLEHKEKIEKIYSENKKKKLKMKIVLKLMIMNSIR